MGVGGVVPVQGGLMGCLPHLAPARKGLLGSGGMVPCHGVPPPSCTGPEGSGGACRGGPMDGSATDYMHLRMFIPAVLGSPEAPSVATLCETACAKTLA